MTERDDDQDYRDRNRDRNRSYRERDERDDDRDRDREDRYRDRERDYDDDRDYRDRDRYDDRESRQHQGGTFWLKPAFLIPVGTVAVALIVWIVLGTTMHFRDTAQTRSVSRNNMMQMTLSLHNYESAYNRLPPSIGGTPTAGAGIKVMNPAAKQVTYSESYGGTCLPVHGFLLPFMEQEPLYRSMGIMGLITERGQEVRVPTMTVGAGPAYRVVVRSYFSPADPSTKTGLVDTLSISQPSYDNNRVPKTAGAPAAVTSYAANFRLFAALGPNEDVVFTFDRKTNFASITDGTSNTIAFAEKYGACTAAAPIEDAATNQGIPVQPAGAGGSLWAEPNLNENSPFFAYPQGGTNTYTTGKGLMFQQQPKPTECNPFQASTPHSAGILVSMADGSVRVVNKRISVETWYRAVRPDDNMPLGGDW